MPFSSAKAKGFSQDSKATNFTQDSKATNFSQNIRTTYFSQNSAVYGRITDSVTPFYIDEEGCNILCYLPYTYYVKILSNGNLLSHVQYGFGSTTLIDGYVPTEKLFIESAMVEVPYPDLYVTTCKNAVLYADGNCTTIIQHVFNGRKMKFLASANFNDIYSCYVEYNGITGYVKEDEITPFTLQNHKNPLTFLPPEPETVLPITQFNSDNLALKIIIVACLLGAGIIALICVFTKKATCEIAASGYYDENDYE